MNAVVKPVSISMVTGLLVWLAVQAVLLPVVDVSDGQGHGPDLGSPEWHRAVIHQTAVRQRWALMAGGATAVLCAAATLVCRCRRPASPASR